MRRERKVRKTELGPEKRLQPAIHVFMRVADVFQAPLMNYSLLFVARGVPPVKAEELSRFIVEACPWLDPNDTVSETLGEEMLLSELPAEVLSVVPARDLVEWHNAQVRKSGFQGSDEQYSKVLQILSSFGIVDSMNEQEKGDFWLVDESFSTPNVFIISFHEKISVELKDSLAIWLSSQAHYQSISIVDEDDEVLFYRSRVT